MLGPTHLQNQTEVWPYMSIQALHDYKKSK